MERIRKTTILFPGSRSNPAKPVSQITDRAKRYRAVKNAPPKPKQCGYCGSKRNVVVDHINGNESIGSADNLMWACKSCNAVVANRLRNAGISKLTRQYNAGKKRGRKVPGLAEYGAAIKVMRGVFPGDVSKAVQTIRSTPPDVRSAYTSKTWPTRRTLYGPSGRQRGLFDGDVPF